MSRTSDNPKLPGQLPGPMNSQSSDEFLFRNRTSGLHGQPLYSPDHVITNFMAILEDLPIKEALDIFALGPFQIRQRKLMAQQCQALYIALWGMALMSSFPDAHWEIFDDYWLQERAKSGKDRTFSERQTLARQDLEHLQEHGSADFSSVSRHLLSHLEFDEPRQKAITLKLALHLRKVYMYVFNNLM